MRDPGNEVGIGHRLFAWIPVRKFRSCVLL